MLHLKAQFKCNSEKLHAEPVTTTLNLGWFAWNSAGPHQQVLLVAEAASPPAHLDDVVTVIFPSYYLLYTWRKRSSLRSALNIKIYAMHAAGFKSFQILETWGPWNSTRDPAFSDKSP